MMDQGEYDRTAKTQETNIDEMGLGDSKVSEDL